MTAAVVVAAAAARQEGVAARVGEGEGAEEELVGASWGGTGRAAQSDL